MIESMPPTAQLAIIAGVFAAVNSVIAAVVVWVSTNQSARIAKEAREDARMARSAEILAATKIAEVAEATAEVKKTLADTTAATDQKLSGIEATGDKNHKLLNSGLGFQMELVAELLEEKAAASGMPADVARAETARRAFAQHEASQKPVGPMPVVVVSEDPVKVTVVDAVNQAGT